jgi:hypothetical protein
MNVVCATMLLKNCKIADGCLELVNVLVGEARRLNGCAKVLANV